MMAKAKVTAIAAASTRGTLILRSRSKSGVSTNKDGERERQQKIPRDIEHADDDGPSHQTLKQRGAPVTTEAPKGRAGPSGITSPARRSHNLGVLRKFPETMSRIRYGSQAGAEARSLSNITNPSKRRFERD
jgi:hypothetical protein